MSILITVGFIAGGALAVAGSVMLLMAAFQQGASWAIACIVVPMGWLGFIVRHWQSARRGVLTCAGGLAIVAGTGLLSTFIAPGDATAAGLASLVPQARAMELATQVRSFASEFRSTTPRSGAVKPQPGSARPSEAVDVQAPTPAGSPLPFDR